MMTEIWDLDGVPEKMSSLGGLTLKNIYLFKTVRLLPGVEMTLLSLPLQNCQITIP